MSEIKQSFGNYIVTYDVETNSLIALESAEHYRKRLEEKSVFEILSKKGEFKKRGSAVVKKELRKSWNRLINNNFFDINQVWYNGAALEATLKCMEKLSEGASVEEAYKPIDVQDPDMPCVYFNMELTGWQNNSISRIIATYHERGEEFNNYRNHYVKSDGKAKTKHL